MWDFWRRHVLPLKPKFPRRPVGGSLGEAKVRIAVLHLPVSVSRVLRRLCTWADLLIWQSWSILVFLTHLDFAFLHMQAGPHIETLPNPKLKACFLKQCGTKKS